MRPFREILFLLFAVSGCSGMFYYPSTGLVLTPKMVGIHYEPVDLPSTDQVILHGWYLHSDNTSNLGPRALVLYLHGNAGNISSHLPSVAWMTKGGLDVLMFDYRGYGVSTGTAEIDGLHDDVRVVLLKARDLAEQQGMPLIVFAQSLGGAMAINVIAHFEYKQDISALVVEGVFSSYRAIAREKMRQIWATWLFSWPASLLFTDIYSPIAAIKSVSPIPLLMIHGDRDEIVNVENARALFEQALEPKELWIAEGYDHLGGSYSAQGRERFWRFILMAVEPKRQVRYTPGQFLGPSRS